MQSQHVVHLRSAGIERAATLGLSDRRVMSMSKHTTDQYGRAYGTQLDPRVMLAMSGHIRGEPWFVPRAEVELPTAERDYIRHVFPQYERWVAEFRGPNGCVDKIAPVNFLNKLIPFAARVVIQDAPYWIRYFPNHQYSRFFINNMPDAYRFWCLNIAIPGASALGNDRNQQEIRNLNEAAR